MEKQETTDIASPMYTVEIGRYDGAYKVRWSFDNWNQAALYFNGLNVWYGYKKRIRYNGQTLARVLTSRY